MYNDIKISQYCNTNSSLHELNPINKIICFIIFIVLLFIRNELLFTCIMSVLLIALIVMSNLNIRLFLRVSWKSIFLLLLVFLLTFVFDLPIQTCFIITLKSLLFILYYTLFVTTTSVNSMLYGFSNILFPLKLFKINIYNISKVIISIITFIPDFIEHSISIIKISSVRGLDYKTGNILNKLKIIKLIFTSKFNRKINLYNFSKEKISYRKYYFTFNDMFILFTHILFIFAVIFKGVVL